MLIGYRRVSTKDQDLSIQTKKLLEAGVEERYIYGGKHSGVSEENKQELERMIDHIRSGDVVIVTKLDRLGRSLKQILEVIDRIHKAEGKLRCIDQPVDTSKDDPMSKAMLNMMGLFAELERDLIRERTMQGRIASGNLGGRPTSIDDKAKDKIKRLHSEGHTKYSLAKQFNISRTSVLRILRGEQ